MFWWNLWNNLWFKNDQSLENRRPASQSEKPNQNRKLWIRFSCWPTRVTKIWPCHQQTPSPRKTEKKWNNPFMFYDDQWSTLLKSGWAYCKNLPSCSSLYRWVSLNCYFRGKITKIIARVWIPGFLRIRSILYRVYMIL